MLGWSAAGRLLLRDRNDVLVVTPPGQFCLPGVALVVGTNTVTLTATDASGNASAPSAPVAIVRTAGSFADLSVAAPDIVFVPSAVRPGENATVIVSVRNGGVSDAPASTLQVALFAPDGAPAVRTLTVPVPAIAAGNRQSVSTNLGSLDQNGLYRVRVTADSERVVTESDEANNVAENQIASSTDGAPLLAVTASRTVFAPNAAVTGEVTVINVSGRFDGYARTDIIAANGDSVASLGDSPLNALGAGARWVSAVNWNATGVFAGDYRIRARLYASDGRLVAERTAAFSIEAVRHLQMAVSADEPNLTVGQTARISGDVTFSDGNAPLSGATLRLSVQAPDGVEVWASPRPLGTVLPGYSLRIDEGWNTQGQPAGIYAIRLVLEAPGYRQSTESSVTLSVPTAAALLVGQLRMTPTATVAIGQDAALTFMVGNRGMAAANATQARVRVYETLDQPAVVEHAVTMDLGVGATQWGMVSLSATPLNLTQHLMVLEARLSGDPAGQWRVLARQGFAVVDAMPPSITVAQPLPNSLNPANVTIRARIVDEHSGIEMTAYSMDDGPWLPLSAGASGDYVQTVTDLSDGTHRLVLMARDTWGNDRYSAGTLFTVDAHPPQIQVNGIAEGDLVNHAVSPSVIVTDTHLESSDIRLDGSPYVSGTPVDGEGAHILSVLAKDRAVNSSQRSVHFAIDRTAPPVSILQPQNGATLSMSAVDVRIASESGAMVALQVGTFTASAVAAADGQALFANVPLVEGSNAVVATARDAAGNLGGPSTVTVRYENASGPGLTGTLQPSAASVAHGAALGVTWRVQNTGTSALSAQELRIRVLSGATLLAEQAFVRDIAIGSALSEALSVETAAWPIGGLSLIFEAKRNGEWSVLDTQPVSLVDLTAPLVTVTAPASGAVTRPPVTLRGQASDAHSTPVTVEAILEGTGAIAMTPGGSDLFQSVPLSLADGEHVLRLRAKDAADNTAESQPVTFVVDSVPPTIRVTGVRDGDLVNQPVTALVTVEDPHPGSTTITLNDQPYVSATAITSSGSYTLRVHAVDAAGNEADYSATFTIDRDAPTVTITQPLPNALLTTASTEVVGSTEPLATVRIRVADFQAEVTAGSDGAFRVGAVPLQSGANVIRAQATDRAQNTGPEVSVSVIYVPSMGQQLSAWFVTLPPTTMRPHALVVDYIVRNLGPDALVQIPIRVALIPEGTDQPVATDSFHLDFPPNGEVPRRSNYATPTATPGRYEVEIFALLRDADGIQQWVSLVKGPTSIVTTCGWPPDRLFWSDFEFDRIFCDNFEPWIEPGSTPHAMPKIRYEGELLHMIAAQNHGLAVGPVVQTGARP
ncbi:Ig-like domain-containing protein [Tahibacter amnicola]|uniref:Ig-like domain-containing protein n=2 Tax=Tahibacter amnicola TaxID=2976241 RepID=A0ABY6BSG9_9GAMM|nr:CARDB domain-containing protein [Tahibacter amnicola]UXI70722.1 Ig-like domain-containing protein [Tahibacter amnicola]